jgi:peroxiredoxin Q/BCP
MGWVAASFCLIKASEGGRRVGALLRLVLDSHSFARRYTFPIDAQGKIAKTYLKVDTSKHSAEIIADLKQLSSSSGK